MDDLLYFVRSERQSQGMASALEAVARQIRKARCDQDLEAAQNQLRLIIRTIEEEKMRHRQACIQFAAQTPDWIDEMKVAV